MKQIAVSGNEKERKEEIILTRIHFFVYGFVLSLSLLSLTLLLTVSHSITFWRKKLSLLLLPSYYCCDNDDPDNINLLALGACAWNKIQPLGFFE